MSHPSRVRGLKFTKERDPAPYTFVAPFTGAWIEIMPCANYLKWLLVSHPSRVRGLKFVFRIFFRRDGDSRTLHGCVD